MRHPALIADFFKVRPLYTFLKMSRGRPPLPNFWLDMKLIRASAETAARQIDAMSK